MATYKVGDFRKFFDLMIAADQKQVPLTVTFKNASRKLTIEIDDVDSCSGFGFNDLNLTVTENGVTTKYNCRNSYFVDSTYFGDPDPQDHWECDLILSGTQNVDFFALLKRYKDLPMTSNVLVHKPEFQELLQNIGETFMAILKSHRGRHLSQKEIMSLYENAVTQGTYNTYNVYVDYDHQDESEDFGASDRDKAY